MKGALAQHPVQFNLETGQPPELLASAGSDLATDEDMAIVIGESPAATGGTLPYSYLWMPGTGLDDPTIETPTLTTALSNTYHLVVTDAFGCTASDSLFVNVTGAGGTNTHQVAGLLVVYPNPTSKVLRLSLSDEWTDGSLIATLVDVSGKTMLMHEWTGEHTNVDLDVTGIASGEYILQLRHGHQTIGHKILVRP